ncbi:MAG: hypothetical protein ABIR81_06105 [Ginsengibacter sp.]
MPKNKQHKQNHFFEKFASKATHATGSTTAILIAFSTVIARGLREPV